MQDTPGILWTLTFHPPPRSRDKCRDGTYYALTARLQQLASEMCGGRLVFVLEGGYCTEAVGASVCEVFRALLGLPSAAAGEQEPPRPEPLAEVQAMLQRVKEAHGLP